MTDFPWIGVWAGGLLVALFIGEIAPKGITYALLAILLIGFLMNNQEQHMNNQNRKGAK